MASNENLVKRTYAKGIEEKRATESHATGLEFHFTKKLLDGYIQRDSHVLEVGCGPGYYGMHYADQCAHYTGIDIVPENIELFRNKIRARGCENVTAEVGDATALQLPDESYDVVLCWGPMYPVQDYRSTACC
jgi:ubiquinone/menaquinone biosynthesis C-methylase UbiE